ncbi:hypothetical protein HGH92_19160 [Chitinophaga varians]|uniref:Uncharacterized protein n=1 Tax=Chitinophaga varians TaxID=2202339 RepID=A0A847RU70_9BACT|nr:hypothetical protein [Chitinophaga varians]NLR66436.1 hypothetical protein [Chitinophaga varians]
MSETEKFYSRFEGSEFDDSLQVITTALEKFTIYGAKEGRFRPEGPIHAIPTRESDIRLYCIRLNKNCIILGNGGIKSSQKISDSPDCLPHWKLLKKFEHAFREKIRWGELGYDRNNKLIPKNGGDLVISFEDL